MNSSSFSKAILTIFVVLDLTAQTLAGTRFASHVSINTPTRSISHGVGDPLPFLSKKNYNRPPSVQRQTKPRLSRVIGYPQIKPAIPFTDEDFFYENSLNSSPWNLNSNIDVAIPLLPPSPYKVDSPDPESLWPEGLFVPPYKPRFGAANRRNDLSSEPNELDPYLLEGSEAIAAVKRSTDHGIYYFHDIPHIESLLANQDLRIDNNLKPHRIASIRHTWPFNRP